MNRIIRDLKKIKLFYCIFFLINVLHWPLYSQYDTTHYIPYFGDLSGQNKMSNLEYESSFGGAYIMFSTFEPGPVNVKIPIFCLVYLLGHSPHNGLFFSINEDKNEKL